MRITLTLNDSAGKPRGTVNLVLDWATMTWKKGDETPGVWLAIAGTDAGRFQVNGTNLEIASCLRSRTGRPTATTRFAPATRKVQ